MTTLRKALSSNLKTLVLNGDYRPISVTSVRRGLNLCLEEKAQIVESFSPPLDFLRSESREITTPSVIVLAQYVRVKLSFSGNNSLGPKLRLQLISERDNFTCQYCGAIAQSVDHVIPKSKGGTGNWDNLVACCTACNNKKGNKLLKDSSLKLKRPPERPQSKEHICMVYAHDKVQRSTWLKYM